MIREDECADLTEELPRWELLKFLWYVRCLRVRRRALVWLYRTRIALPWTYWLITVERP